MPPIDHAGTDPMLVLAALFAVILLRRLALGSFAAPIRVRN